MLILKYLVSIFILFSANNILVFVFSGELKLLYISPEALPDEHERHIKTILITSSDDTSVIYLFFLEPFLTNTSANYVFKYYGEF